MKIIGEICYKYMPKLFSLFNYENIKISPMIVFHLKSKELYCLEMFSKNIKSFQES
jgi:hypothetical protein